MATPERKTPEEWRAEQVEREKARLARFAGGRIVEVIVEPNADDVFVPWVGFLVELADGKRLILEPWADSECNAPGHAGIGRDSK